MTRATCVLILWTALLTACGRRPEVPPDDAGQRPESAPASDTMEVPVGAPVTSGADSGGVQLTGTIVVTGLEAATFPTLQVEGRRPVRLEGALAGELRRLSGATVRVDGRSGGEAGQAPLATGSVDVRSYDILSIDGERPHTGVLLVRDGETLLAAADTVRLVAVPEPLRARTGAKVWIVGRRAGSELQVQSYGIIADP